MTAFDRVMEEFRGQQLRAKYIAYYSNLVGYPVNYEQALAIDQARAEMRCIKPSPTEWPMVSSVSEYQYCKWLGDYTRGDISKDDWNGWIKHTLQIKDHPCKPEKWV